MNTRDEIVYLADGFIRSRGYNAFSYSDIGEYMRIRPAAVHYHFHSKTDLGLEVIRQELLPLKQVEPGGAYLKRLFATFFHSCQKGQICLMGSLMPDFATFDPLMQGAVQEMCSTIADWVAASLEVERKQGRMQFDGTAEDRALLVVSGLLSSLLLSRVMGKDVFVRMADQLLRDLSADWRVADLEHLL
jgi:TetR/AcrR family transcriptional regulator, transcriptional repressor for nem operon